MSITVGDNFSYQGAKPLDARVQFASVADMKAYAEASLYNGCLAYVTATKKNYQYDSSNTVDTDTGRWRELQTGGGGGTSDYNDLTNKPQIAGTTLSGNTSLATLGLTSSVESQSSGGTTKSYVNTGEKYNWNTGNTVYGTCSTSASTTAKSVTVSRGTFNFTAGARIAIKFSYTNTASAPTLTVNSTTKNIKCIDETGSTYTPVVWWDANDIVEFIYDGTQFLMQPTTGMMFKIHGTTIPRESIYSTAEKVVGCWTDGRPIYQKTITGTAPSTANTAKYYAIGATVSTMVKATFMLYDGAGNYLQFEGVNLISSSFTSNTITGVKSGITNNSATSNKNSASIVCNNSSWLDKNVYITVQYTKTTDSANSFNYADPNDYSTSEKIVGTWIDGSALYQKTFSYTCPTTNTDGVDVQTSATSSLLIGTNIVVRKFDSTIQQSNGNVHMLPIVNSSTATVDSAVKTAGTKVLTTKSGTSVYLACINSRTASNGSTIITTVQYTK